MKRLPLIAFLLLAVCRPAVADDRKPNTLTKEEIADGWILLFDGATTFGWKVDGDTRVENGALIVGGEKTVRVATTSSFGDIELHLQYRQTGSKGDAALVHSIANLGLAFPTGADDGWSEVTLMSKVGELIHKSPVGVQSFRKFDPTTNKALQETCVSPIGFLVPAGSQLVVRNIKLKPLNLKPIFNGKNLTGWKEIPGHKSKFSVNDQGQLNIKDGNGDIQTEGEYDDFVLQIDCFSNGDHLNSGVFFRCIKDSFWSGYEAQIRNEWITDVKLKDGTTVSGSYTDKGDKVTVQTCTKAKNFENNWIPGREIKTINKADIEEVIQHRDQVVDIGTGGIYNRQPARKVVSNDREWYTMTVVAQGTHVATWVNGYQVADFIDTAPIGDNARKGAKVSKGPLSLQGHDPTTDLNFKNIRIAELPKADEKK